MFSINSLILNDFKCLKLLLFLFFEVINASESGNKCGIPGISLKSSLKTVLSNEKVVENGVKVKYSCDYNDAPFLIGHNERECMDGEWTHSIPKCATLYTGKYDFDFTPNGNAVNISLAFSAKISGIVVRVSSQEPIELVNIKNIPSPDCFVANTTFKDKIPYHLTKRYSTLFHCPTKDTNFWSHSAVSWILITFSEKFKNCELTACPALLEFFELYESVNDQCFKPDVPAFSRLVPMKINGSIVSYKYECEDYFVMQERTMSDIICTDSDEWNYKKLPKCVPNITCEVETIDHLNTKYNWLWSETEAVVGTVATVECVDNFTKINGSHKIECRSDGQWNEEWPQCIEIKTTTTTTTTPSLPSTSHQMNEQNDGFYTTIKIPDPNIQTIYKPIENRPVYPYSPIMVTTVVPVIHFTQPNSAANSLNSIQFVYIFSGILLGILITISAIYYIQKRRRKREISHSKSQLRSGQHCSGTDDILYDHINHSLNESRTLNTGLNERIDNSPYDSAGYIQIEAVESMRMNTFKKYENYDSNASKKLAKPLPQVPN